MKDILVLSQANQVLEKMNNSDSASESSINSSTYSDFERQESEVDEQSNKRIRTPMPNTLCVNNGKFDTHDCLFAFN